MWSRKKQAEQAKRCMEMLHELHIHVTDMTAGGDLNEIEWKLAHALKVLQARAEAET